MRNALAEILDGAIGHVGAGYHAPQARMNVDEEAELRFEQNAKHTTWGTSPAPRPTVSQDALRRRVLAIVAEHGPVPQREIATRLRRQGVEHAGRLFPLLRSMRAKGEVRGTRVGSKYGQGWQYLYEVPGA